MVKYVADEDTEIVKIIRIEIKEGQTEYSVEGKSGLPFDIKVNNLRKINVLDAKKIHYKWKN
eukprot:336099-Ditylum_brightwellii.AAC.1